MTLRSNITTRRLRAASLAFATSALFAASGVSALAQNGKPAHAVHARDYRAIYLPESYGRCVPANGAQIMGGFAGPSDWVDAVSGDVCHR